MPAKLPSLSGETRITKLINKNAFDENLSLTMAIARASLSSGSLAGTLVVSFSEWITVTVCFVGFVGRFLLAMLTGIDVEHQLDLEQRRRCQ